MLKAYIVDDEINNINNLKFVLENDCDQIAVVGTATNGPEARAYLQQHKVDVVFLDISMPGETGFEMLQALPQKDFQVVFVTAHNEYGIQAVKASAIDYILKPINTIEINAAIKKVRNLKSIVGDNQNEELLEQLLSNLKHNQPSSKIALPQSGKFIFLDLDEIVSVQADGNYSIIYKKDLEKIVVTKTLKDFEDILDAEKFFRIHKSNIINIDYVTEYVQTDGGSVKMADGTELSISRRQTDLFIAALKSRNLIYFRKEN